MSEYDLPSSGKSNQPRKGFNPKTMSRRSKIVLLGILALVALGAAIPLWGPALASLIYSGHATSPYSQTTPPTISAAFAVASGTIAPTSGTCTSTLSAGSYTLTCPSVTYDSGSSYSVSVSVTGATGTTGSITGVSSETNCQGAGPGVSTSFAIASGSGSFSCTVTPTASSGTSSFNFSFSGP